MAKAPRIGDDVYFLSDDKLSEGQSVQARTAKITEVLDAKTVSLIVFFPTHAAFMLNVPRGNKISNWCYQGEHGI